MENDDLTVGRVLSRREAISVLGSSGVMLWMGAPAPVKGQFAGQGVSACVVRPELTEGPYFVDERLQRSDIRGDPSDGRVRDGALLALTFNVARAGARCTPLAGAVIDLWHCDALGVYSDVQDRGFDTTGQKFLRGYQVTDADGLARFTTIFPGWYQGRAVHLHFKLRSPASVPRSWEFTSQLFFTDSLTDTVHAQQPYAAKGQRSLRNGGDRIYRSGGAQLVLDVHPTPAGFGAAFDIALEGV